MDAWAAAVRRDEAMARYRPERIELLLVAEAPPCKLDRYFYFEDVREQDSLFRYVAKLILGYVPARDAKREALLELQEQGVFLIDLKEDPTTDDDPAEFVDDLVVRCRKLEPESIVVIKASVFDTVYRPLAEAGLPVVNERIPFPGSGQQRRFEECFGRALEAAGSA